MFVYISGGSRWPKRSFPRAAAPAPGPLPALTINPNARPDFQVEDQASARATSPACATTTALISDSRGLESALTRTMLVAGRVQTLLPCTRPRCSTTVVPISVRLVSPHHRMDIRCDTVISSYVLPVGVLKSRYARVFALVEC